MLPLFGLTAFIYPLLIKFVKAYPWYGRGLIYAFIVLVIQFLAGWSLNKINVHPWRQNEKWSLGGYIYIPYAPLWFLYGLFVEWLWGNFLPI
jgi:hypothetical protein